MNFVLCDEDLHWKNFLPLTFTRPVSEIRIGILTIREKWEKHLGVACSYHTQAYLSEKFPYHSGAENTFILSSFLPDAKLCEAILALKTGEALFGNNRFRRS
jgi:hypothetical protein